MGRRQTSPEEREHRTRANAAELARITAELQRADDLWYATKALARGEITQAEFDAFTGG